MLKSILKYTPWAFFQQFWMVFLYLALSRIMSPGWAIAATVVVFAGLHIPNLFLIALALCIEPLFLYFYESALSLIWITAIHSTVAVIAERYIPESVTHGMKVLWQYKKEGR